MKLRVAVLVLLCSLLSYGVTQAASLADLQVAIEAGSYERVAALVSADPDLVDMTDPAGRTPLHLAAAAGKPSVLQALLDAGADPEARTGTGDTALDLALVAGAEKTAYLLVEQSLTVYTVGTLTGAAARGNVAALESGRDTLSSLLRKHPESQRVNVALGQVSHAAAEYGHAQLAYERVLEVDPGNHRARLELARAYLADGRTAEAREAFETVLADDPPPEVERKIRGYLASMKDDRGDWSAIARVDVGWMRDDNVNVGPNTATIDIAPIAFGAGTLTQLELAAASLPVDTHGAFASLAASAAYDPDSAGGLAGIVEVGAYGNLLQDASEHESLFVQGAAGARYSKPRTLAKALLRAGHIQHGGNALVNMFGVQSLYVQGLNKTGRLSWWTPILAEYRDYDVLNDRDGIYAALGQSLRYAFSGMRHFVFTGLQLFHDFTEADAFEQTGLVWLAGGQAQVHARLRLQAASRVSASRYDGREPLAPEDREDIIVQLTAGASTDLTDHWGLEVKHQWTDSSSTFDLYDYQRNLTTVATWIVF